MIKNRLDKGQLDNTDLTLRDLETIRNSFVSTLKGIHHPRIRYPETAADSEQQAEASKTISPPPPVQQ